MILLSFLYLCWTFSFQAKNKGCHPNTHWDWEFTLKRTGRLRKSNLVGEALCLCLHLQQEEDKCIQLTLSWEICTNNLEWWMGTLDFLLDRGFMWRPLQHNHWKILFFKRHGSDHLSSLKLLPICYWRGQKNCFHWTLYLWNLSRQ